MSFTGKLHIDGCVEGNITSVENVSIGKSGKVNGIIRAKNISVSGLLEGEVYCQQLHIAAGGRVVANIVSVELTMDSKSQFIGERRESGADNLQAETILLDKPKLDVIDDLPDKITLMAEPKVNKKATKKALPAQAKKAQQEPVQNKKIASLAEKINKKAKSKPQPLASETAAIKQPKPQPQPAAKSTPVPADSLLLSPATQTSEVAAALTPAQDAVSAIEQQKITTEQALTQAKVKVVDKNTTLLELKF
ncbi:MAG: hypothetical protein OFPI_21180 [Osedax symbiont Rs2]|nr:MAG: hypothetical protein OFPI_21180 [Osedax symbiont Rs2]